MNKAILYTPRTEKGRTRDCVTLSTWQKSSKVKTHFCKYFVQCHCSVYEARFSWSKMLLIGSYFAIFALRVRFLTDRLRYTLWAWYVSVFLFSIFPFVYHLSIHCLSVCLSVYQICFTQLKTTHFVFIFFPLFFYVALHSEALSIY